MADHPRISLDPKVLVGKPVIKGTRISVEFVLELLASRWTFAKIVEEFGVVEADLVACLNYARDRVSKKRAHQTPPVQGGTQ